MFFTIECGIIFRQSDYLIDKNGKQIVNMQPKYAMFLLLLVYILIVGFRYQVGVDYLNYESWYNIYCKTDKFPVEGQDRGYLLLNYIAKLLGMPFTFINIILTFLIILPVSKSLKFAKFLYPLFFFFYFTIIFNESLNVMRQVAAFFLWFYAYCLYFKKSNKKKIFSIALLGFFIHKSSILSLIWLPFIKLDLFKNKYITLGILLLSCVLGSVFYSDFKNIMMAGAGLMGGNIADYNDSWRMQQFELYSAANQGEGIAKNLYLVIDFFLILSSTQLKTVYNKYHFSFFYNLFVIGEILTPIVSANTIFLRVNYYFSLHKIIVMSFYCHYLWNSKKHLIIKKSLLFSILFIYFFLHIRHIINNDAINHYQSVFFN